jgi:hypothetical protein
MDSTKGRHTIKNGAGQIEENISELEAELIDIDPVEIGTEAKQLDAGQTLTERARLPRSTIRRLGYLGIMYFIGLAVMVPFFDTTTQAFLLPLLAAIGGPYLVRVMPNQVWRYVIPLYAFTIGLLGLTIGLDI